MGDYHALHQSADGDTTEWDDLQRKIGNLPPKPPKWKPEPFQPESEEAKDRDWIDGRKEDELEDLEDDFDDDQFLEEYRRRRLEELKASAASGGVYGSVKEIGGGEFVAEVTNAGQGVWVAVLLYKDGHEGCEAMVACFEALASQFTTTKFVKIVSTECIPGYPDCNLPTVLVYNNTNCKRHLVGMRHFGGGRPTPETVAQALNECGPLCTS